jgi:DNA-binding NtrC family response regulator
MEETKILLFDLNPPSDLSGRIREILEASLKPYLRFQQKTMEISGSICCNEISDAISDFAPALIFLLVSSNSLNQPTSFIQSLGKGHLQLPVIAVIEGGTQDEMIDVLRLGVTDFITPPLKAVDVVPRVLRLLKRQEDRLPCALKEKLGLKQLVGKSEVLAAEVNKIPLVAKCDTKVMISGETGTGKELFARAIHYLSLRADKPFVPVNCGAIPVELVENELFGHVEGAFTGASKSYPGLIREANGGTLFLDEISSLHLSAQVKLLRFLQDKEYRQLGTSKIVQADVRVIAASNVDLERVVSEGRFRKDLFYRLNIFTFILPPLRDRTEDIPLLAHHFLRRYASEFDKTITDFTSEAMQKLMLYHWPGNVRELENVIERAAVISRHSVIDDGDIRLKDIEPSVQHESFRTAKSKVIEQFELDYIHRLLYTYQGNISRAAKAAQKNRRAFWELIKKYKIDVQNFTSGSL